MQRERQRERERDRGDAGRVSVVYDQGRRCIRERVRNAKRAITREIATRMILTSPILRAISHSLTLRNSSHLRTITSTGERNGPFRDFLIRNEGTWFEKEATSFLAIYLERGIPDLLGRKER